MTDNVPHGGEPATEHGPTIDVSHLPRSADPLARLSIVTEPGSVIAETIRSVRTRLVAQHLRLGRRALAICSVTESARADFVAANLAVAMAQIDVRTLLIDTDLRTGGIASFFGIAEDSPGLSDLLTDENRHLDEVARTSLLENLTVVPAGSPSSAPQELLTSAAFARLADQCMREFDCTIFATTPSNRCTDAQRVAHVARYTLLVARKNHSYMRDIARLAELLKSDNATIAGSVLLDA